MLIKIRCTFGPVLWNSLIFLLVKLCKCFQILFKTKCGVAMTLLNAFIFICINRTFLTDKNSLNILLILEWNLCLQIKIMILFKKNEIDFQFCRSLPLKRMMMLILHCSGFYLYRHSPSVLASASLGDKGSEVC